MPAPTPGLGAGPLTAAPAPGPSSNRAGGAAAGSVFDALVAVLLAGEEAPGEATGEGSPDQDSEQDPQGQETAGPDRASSKLPTPPVPVICSLPTPQDLGAPVAAAEPTGTAAEAEEPVGDDDLDAVAQPAADVAGLARPDVLAGLGPQVRLQPGSAAAGTETAATAGGGSVDAVTAGGAAEQTATDLATPATPTPGGETGGGEAGSAGGGSEDGGSDEGAGHDAGAPVAASGPATTTDPETRTAAAPAAAPASPTASTLPLAAGPAPAAPATSARPTPLTGAQSRTLVADQVAPALARLTQAGPGTHRLVIKLDPEDLGPVRVTLTLHQGSVSVRLAAGSAQARAALAEGSSELHRLLGTRATETRVSVHDLAAPALAGSDLRVAEPRGLDSSARWDEQRPGSTETTTSGRGQHGSRSGEQERPARTRVGSEARDGTTVTAIRPGPTDPPTSRRMRLDVSI